MSATTDYGSDLSGVEDLAGDMAEVSGRLLLAQSSACRLITPRGTLIDDPNYGTDLRDYLNDDVGASELAQIEAGAAAEIAKDERVVRCTAKATFAGGVLLLELLIVDGDGPFKLVLAISDVSVSILKVT